METNFENQVVAPHDRFVRQICLTLASAGLYVLAFPPFNFRALAWVALAPLIIAACSARPLAALAYGLVWSFVTAVGVTYWLPVTLAGYYSQPLWLGWTLFAGATSIMVALEYSLFGVACALLQRAGWRPRCLLIAAAWVSAEFFRERLFTGNPWAFAGYSQVGADIAGAMPGAMPSWSSWTSWMFAPPIALVQVADLAGVYGVSFVIVTINAAIAQAVLSARSFDRAKSFRTETAAALILLIATYVYGGWRLGELREGTSGPVHEIAVIQGDLDIGAQWAPQFYGANLQVYLKLTAQALQEKNPALVVWPENAMTFFVDREPAFRKTIASTTAGSGIELLSGAPRAVGDPPEHYFNGATLLSADADVEGSYDKEVLLPFAEYFPLSQIDILRRSFGRVRAFTPGTATSPIDTEIGKAGVLICNEAMFGGLGRKRVNDGAEFLVNLSNDSWVAAPMFAEQQLQIATMRAIETRRYLVRASTSGPSAIVAPSGRVLARTDTRVPAVLHGRIHSRSALTPYSRWGNVFAFACIFILASALVGDRLRHRRTRENL